ncbi:RAD51-associated protein 1-like isoform X2 [Acanthaster planci]|uniref:RAD51-associated protein 1-like isoform X2 n=1 Tax=Acanthaster planci TaxID=133434 RepID=A0A8B7XUS0_ACAPL|nr:RAD51-associated protein 1-like isoform X2 [Acanthaster planci]
MLIEICLMVGDHRDDFARSTPPPSKRTKLEKKDKQSKTKAGVPKTTATTDDGNVTGRGPRKERVPLDEKIFDREMQLAMELSRQESQPSQDKQTKEQTTNKQTAGKTKNVEAQIHTGSTEKTTHGDCSSKNVPSEDKENICVRPAKPAASSPDPCDEIVLVETLDEDEVVSGRRKRQAAKAAVAKQREMMSEESDGRDEDEEDFKAESGDDSSSDEFDADDADSDYEEFASSKSKTTKTKGRSPRSSERGKKSDAVGRTKKTSGDKKSKPATKAAKRTDSTPKPSVLKPSTPVTPLAKHPQKTGHIRGFTPPATTRDKNSQPTNQRVLQSTAVVRKPGWSSPSNASESNPLGGVKLVSPSQPIRLGLSRNVRIKPLHPNAKVH